MRIRISIDVDVQAPTQHEMGELRAIIQHEAPQFVNETCGVVFAEQFEFHAVIVHDVENVIE